MKKKILDITEIVALILAVFASFSDAPSADASVMIFLAIAIYIRVNIIDIRTKEGFKDDDL